MTLPFNKETFARMSATMTRHEAIATLFEKAFVEESMTAGTRLPTVRKLAAELEVSVSTVVAAYHLLQSRGWTHGKVGRGTFVGGETASADEAGKTGAIADWTAPVQSRRPPWRRRMVLSSVNRLAILHPSAIDCTSGKPDTSLIPTEIVRRAWHRALDETRPGDLQYANPAPAETLKAALAPRLMRDGISLAGTETVVGTSAQQLMVLSVSIASDMAQGRPRVVAVEEPGYQTVFDAFEHLGFRLVGMEVDEQGATPDSLNKALHAGAVAVLFTPRAQNPKGVSWTPQRRAALSAVLAAHPSVVAIEDDQFADMAETRPGSLLNSKDIADRVIYIRSFAKSIAPDIRIAVALTQPRLGSLLVEAKSLWDGWSSRISQRALANVLSDADLEMALHSIRQHYAQRRRAALEILNDRLRNSGGSATGGDGLNIWIRLPFGAAAADVVERAAALGVLLVSGEPFYIRPGHNDVVRMSISAVNEEEAALAAARVAQAISTTASLPAMSIPV